MEIWRVHIWLLLGKQGDYPYYLSQSFEKEWFFAVSLFPEYKGRGEVSLTVADFQNYKVQVKFNIFYKITSILFHVF